jgi:hypothetical protein
VSRPGAVMPLVMLLMWFVPSVTYAQPSPAGTPSEPSRLWLVAGASSATVRGDCQTCEADFPYRQAAAVLVNVGRRLSDRMDVGGELFWVPSQTSSGRVRITHIDAVAQFRPWASHGFFVKGGAGMAWVRNWVDGVGPPEINQKALSVVIGAGWLFPLTPRVGMQLLGSQHAGALGDFQTAAGEVQDVMGNFWSIGVGLVIR